MKDIFKILALLAAGAGLFYFRTAKKIQALKVTFDKVAKVTIKDFKLIVSFSLSLTNPNQKEGITLQEINLTVSDTSGNRANIVKSNINQLIPPLSVKPFKLTANIGVSEAINVVTNLLDIFNQKQSVNAAMPKTLNVTGFIVSDKMKFPVNTTIQTTV